MLEYLNRARTDAEIYSEKEIIQGIEGEYMNVLDKIREEGKLEGKLEGRLEGKLEGKLEGEFKKALETAQKMQKERESLQKIIQYSGLSEDQLRENGIL